MFNLNEADLRELKEVADDLDSPVGSEFFTQFSEETKEELYTFAYFFYGNGKYKEALHFFRLLTVMDSHNVKYWMGFAASLQLLKEYEKALNAYSIAAMINPDDAYVHFHAADCCFALGYIDRGMIALDSVESIAQENQQKYGSLISQLALLRQAWLNKKQTD